MLRGGNAVIIDHSPGETMIVQPLTPLKVFTVKRTARPGSVQQPVQKYCDLHKAIFVERNPEIAPCLSEEPISS